MIISKTIDVSSLSKTQQLFLVCIFIPAFYLSINYFLKNQAYYLSLEKVVNHDEIIMHLGKPLKAGYFLSGEAGGIETELNYTVSGPLNSADVYLYAQAINGLCVIKELEVKVNNTNKVIDVLSES